MKALDLGSGCVFSTVCKLVFPAMIAQFINVLYSIVDRIYVGNIQGIGDTALAAVGVCAPVTTLISSFAFLIGTGGAPLFAMALGEKRRGRAEKYILFLCIGYIVLMTLISLFLAAPFVSMFTKTPDIAQKSVWGIRVFMTGAIPLAFQYAFVDGLTALGQPQYAIVLSMARKLVIFLGCILILPLFWGVQAIFYAEPVADIASAVLSSTLFAIVFPRILKKRMAK